MDTFVIQKEVARLIVFQRVELLNPLLKRLRKLFGRKLFTSFISKFFLNANEIGKKYFDRMNEEYNSISRYVTENDKTILSIGAGMGGLEVIINKNFRDRNFFFIEKNYVSKKIKYGWDSNNDEAYNNLNLQKNFLIQNGLRVSNINIFNFDRNKFPNQKFDLITSLYSLDYHYDFNIYENYLKKCSNDKTKIIFDTIRSDYFTEKFKNVEIIENQINTVHRSKRIVCSSFIG